MHPLNALGIRQFADTWGCVSLVESADKYIQQCFHEVSLYDEYINLNFQDVKNLLQKNELRVERYVHFFYEIEPHTVHTHTHFNLWFKR